MSDRSLIAAVGQPWMRDLAFGSHVIRHLKTTAPPVDVADLSFNPITACQFIEDGGYGSIVFVTSRAAGRERGVIYEITPERTASLPADVHAHIGDAVMGSVSLETLLVLCRFRSALPERTLILEVEPEDESWGPELSPALQKLVAPAATLALRRSGADLS